MSANSSTNLIDASPATTPPTTPPTAPETDNAVGVAGPIQVIPQSPPGEEVLTDFDCNETMQRRRLSLYRILARLDRDNRPTQEYLLPAAPPVALPVIPHSSTQPTLSEMLCRATGRTNFQNVDAIKFRFISNMISLSPLPAFMPFLTYLDLSGSVLNSMRDVGCRLLHLTQLNVNHCGLRSFDGINAFPKLQVLVADGNMVQQVGPLADLRLLKHLSARYNHISDLETLTFLGMCPNLVQLELQGNAVTHSMLYRLTLRRCVCSLEFLDGESLCTGTKENDVGTSQEVTQEYVVEKTIDFFAALSLSSALNTPQADHSDSSLFLLEPNFDLMLGSDSTSDDPASDIPSVTSNNRLLSATPPLAGSALDVVGQGEQQQSGSNCSDIAPNSLSTSLNGLLSKFLCNDNNNNKNANFKRPALRRSSF